MDYVEESGEDAVSVDTVLFDTLRCRLNRCIVRDLVDEICRWAVARLVHFKFIFANVPYPSSNRTINGGLGSAMACRSAAKLLSSMLGLPMQRSFSRLAPRWSLEYDQI